MWTIGKEIIFFHKWPDGLYTKLQRMGQKTYKETICGTNAITPTSQDTNLIHINQLLSFISVMTHMSLK